VNHWSDLAFWFSLYIIKELSSFSVAFWLNAVKTEKVFLREDIARRSAWLFMESFL
jgi:hypothetical protein